MKIVSNIFYGAFIILLLIVGLLFLAPLLPFEQNISMKIVESGSMEPAIKTGSLVVIIPTTNYGVGDVITFTSISASIPTTHRIVSVTEENGGKVFMTKGDANEEADTDVVSESKVIGKVQVSVPYAGFILDFARQPLGFAFLIVLPALLIIFGEIEKIWREIRKNRKGGNGGTPTSAQAIVPEPEVEVREIVRMIEIGRPIFSYETITRVRHLSVQSFTQQRHRNVPFGEIAISLCAVVTSVCFAGLSFVGSTVSYFNDTEASLGNMFKAQMLDFTLSADDVTYSFIGTELDDVDGALIAIAAPAQGSTQMKYDVSTNVVGLNTLFCESIQVGASLPLLYSGKLVNLSGLGIVFDQPWTLALSLPADYGPFEAGEVCMIEVEYTAWNVTSPLGAGYSDTEKVTLVFTAPASLDALLVEPLLLSAPELFTDEGVEGELPEEVPDVEETREPTVEALPQEPEEISETEEIEKPVELEEEAEVEETEAVEAVVEEPVEVEEGEVV